MRFPAGRHSLRLISLLLILICSNQIRSQDTIPGDFCISEEEYKLFNLINEYRKALNLPQVQLSKSLCYVAKVHVADLNTNKPDTNTCNFHSWSNKGEWMDCCFEKKIKDKSCMLNKARELTNFPGVAYEVVYWENKQANAEKAFDQWRETSAARSLISNMKTWESYSWFSLGVGIDHGFAIAWFGEDPDVEKNTKICGSDKLIEHKLIQEGVVQKVITAETGRFYIIIGSFGSLEDAKKHLENYDKQGFKKAKVITKDGKFRISFSDYPSNELAAAAKKELPSKFKDAWILPW